MGTFESMQQAASYVRAVQNRQGFKIACVEEIAYRLGYITSDQLKDIASQMNKNDYGRYLYEIADSTPAEIAKWL